MEKRCKFYSRERLTSFSNDLIFVGGISDKLWLDDGKKFSRNYSQGNRVYSEEGIAATLNTGGGTGGGTGLYLIKAT